MPTIALSDDEFRLLAYLRGYPDWYGQSLDPEWVRQQLEWPLPRLQEVSRRLAAIGLVRFFEFDPPEALLFQHPEIAAGPMPCDIRLTEAGWNYLRR